MDIALSGFNLGTVLLGSVVLFPLASLFFGTRGGYYNTDQATATALPTEHDCKPSRSRRHHRRSVSPSQLAESYLEHCKGVIIPPGPPNNTGPPVQSAPMRSGRGDRPGSGHNVALVTPALSFGMAEHHPASPNDEFRWPRWR